MTYLARLTPEASCEVILQPAEWRLLRRKFVPKSRSQKPPSLQQAMLWIAQLGGFLARKGDGKLPRGDLLGDVAKGDRKRLHKDS